MAHLDLGGPGNARQLARVLERAIALAPRPEIAVTDLLDAIRRDYCQMAHESVTRDDTLRAWSSRYVRLALERATATSARRATSWTSASTH